MTAQRSRPPESNVTGTHRPPKLQVSVDAGSLSLQGVTTLSQPVTWGLHSLGTRETSPLVPLNFVMYPVESLLRRNGIYDVSRFIYLRESVSTHEQGEGQRQREKQAPS